MDAFRKKGSLTVEAAFVVPLCLMVCFFLLQALLYLHHVSWYTAAAWECVLTELQEGENTENGQERWQSLKAQQVLPVGTLEAETDFSGNTVGMRIRGSMSALARIPAMTFDLKIQRSVQKPASFLRKARNAKLLTDIAGGQG